MEDNNTKNCGDVVDNFWEEYKKHSGKVSIFLSVLGGVGAILAGKLILASSIVLGVTNVAIFFSAVCYEKLQGDMKLLKKDNSSLKDEKNEMVRKLTFYKFPDTPHSTEYERLKDVRDYLNQLPTSNQTIPSEPSADAS